MSEPQPKKRSWWPVIIGVVIALVIIAAGSIAITISYVREHLEVEQASADEVDRAFDEARAKFPGKPALMRVVDRMPQVNTERATAQPSTTRLTTLYVLAFDPRDGRLARFQLPFWFLRLKATPIKFSSYAGGLINDGVQLDVETIEKNGPGLVLDMEEPGGDRILVWAE